MSYDNSCLYDYTSVIRSVSLHVSEYKRYYYNVTNNNLHHIDAIWIWSYIGQVVLLNV